MEKLIASPIDRQLIKEELTEDKLLRSANKAGNQIYVVTAFTAPNTMKEIGRLREISFREAGGGTGKSLDIDSYDIYPDNPYKQLIVWDPENEEIVGGYRYHVCNTSHILPDGSLNFATAELFRFSDRFKKDYLPYTIELGRSFIQPKYQSTNSSRKSIYALDNLWDGLCGLLVHHPHVRYFIGKVTMYPSYNREARDLILHYLSMWFKDKGNLFEPYNPLFPDMPENKAHEILNAGSSKESFRLLSSHIRKLGVNIPPLISSYINVSASLRTFGTSINKGFGNVEETGIMVTAADIYPDKLDRHLNSYSPNIYFK